MDTKVLKKSAKTVDEAIELALNELEASRDEVEIEVIEEGNKGLLGLIGSKDAVVKVTLLPNAGAIAESFLLDIFNTMGIEADLYIEEDDESIEVEITGDNIGILIGRRGDTLDALQYLTSLAVNRKISDYKRVIIDIENYREKRSETLKKLANKMARRVVKYGKTVTLEPMNPYERRIIHSALQTHKKIKTYSTGEEPTRRIVITLK